MLPYLILLMFFNLFLIFAAISMYSFVKWCWCVWISVTVSKKFSIYQFWIWDTITVLSRNFYGAVLASVAISCIPWLQSTLKVPQRPDGKLWRMSKTSYVLVKHAVYAGYQQSCMFGQWTQSCTGDQGSMESSNGPFEKEDPCHV